MSPGGTWAWAIKGGSSYKSYARDLLVDAKGNSYLAFNFDSVFKFGSLSLLGQLYDFGLIKVDPSGKPLWAIRAGGPEDDVPREMRLDGKGNLYVGGQCQDYAKFGSTPTLRGTPYNIFDMCVAKLKVSQ